MKRRAMLCHALLIPAALLLAMPARSALTEENITAVMEATGTASQLKLVEGLYLENIKTQAESSASVREAFQRAAKETTDPARLDRRFRELLRAELADGDTEALVKFGKTPLGSKVRELEVRAMAPEATRAFLARMQSPPELSPEREQLLKTGLNSRVQTDGMVDVMLESMERSFKAHRTDLAPSERNKAWLAYRKGQVKPLRDHLETMRILHQSMMYEDLTDAELKQLVEWHSAGAGARFSDAHQKFQVEVYRNWLRRTEELRRER